MGLIAGALFLTGRDVAPFRLSLADSLPLTIRKRLGACGQIVRSAFDKIRKKPLTNFLGGVVLTDKYLPKFDVREYHETRVNAPADAAYDALRSLDLNRSWIVRTLFAIRTLPSRLQPGKSPAPESGTFLEQALALGWIILEEVPGRELVAGAVTQPWAPVARFQGLPPAEFIGFSNPGFTKIVWAIAARPVMSEVTLLSTETRVLATDEASKRKFRRYWWVFGAGIRLIRRVGLTMAKRQLRRQGRAA